MGATWESQGSTQGLTPARNRGQACLEMCRDLSLLRVYRCRHYSYCAVSSRAHISEHACIYETGNIKHEIIFNILFS